jgi:hypothetical protein
MKVVIRGNTSTLVLIEIDKCSPLSLVSSTDLFSPRRRLNHHLQPTETTFTLVAMFSQFSISVNPKHLDTNKHQ